MRWNILIYDPKIALLLIILVIFLVLSIVIIYFETKYKKRAKVKFTQNVEETRLSILRNGLKKAHTPLEKLAVIDKQAKSLFHERHNINTKKSYSELSKEFTGRKLYQYAQLCDKMFEAYYTQAQLSDHTIKELLTILTKLIREKTTYLDPASYSIENLIEGQTQKSQKPKIIYRKSRNEKKVIKEKKFIEEKSKSIKDQEKALKEKQKLLAQKEEEIAKKEKQNKRFIHEIEKRLKEQEAKIKREEEIQEQIARQMNLTRNEPGPKIKKVFHKQTIKEHESKDHHKKHHDEEKSHEWRHDIETNPIVGKDWLKQRRRRNKK